MCTLTVKKATPKLNVTSVELPYGNSKTLKLKNTKKKVKWTTSNKKIATVNAKGKVTAKGIGKCKITAKCGKKKYTCNVKVYRMWADFTALLTDYNTRNNYFVVKFKNYGSKSLVINSKGAYCMDVDYKSYDRNLRLAGNKNITIKPHKSKTVKFYVIGSTTWWDYEDFTIRYYFRYNGAKYLGSVWDENSTHKRAKKWYSTYWYKEDIYNMMGEDYI
ncbi:MAG: Ig-like domain-containing protein [Eubacterium sp.]|nr:Ig-like domain-containing protein [Eubacterium sp.]